jgi:hypothetical protein
MFSTTRKELKEANERLEASGIKTRILFFADSPKRGCGATALLASGEPCILSIAQSGIVVKKSRHFFFGSVLYNEKNVYLNARRTGALAYLFPDKQFPESISSPSLRAFFNAILHSRSAVEVCTTLNEAIPMAEAKAGCGLDELRASDFPAWSLPGSPREEMDAEQRAKDMQIVEAFGAMLEREPPDPTLIYDVKRLPFGKNQIQNALLRLSETDTQSELRSHMQMAFLALAYYQPGVGEPPIDTIGFRGSLPERIKRLVLAREKLSPEDMTEVRAHAEKVAAGVDPRAREFKGLVDHEIEYLQNVFKRAENGQP